MVEEIFALAMVLGRISEADKGPLRELCRGAHMELSLRLKDGVGAEDCAPAFVLAAAWYALADLCMGECVDGVGTFRAGELSIQQDKTTPRERGEGLRQRAELVLAPYTRDQGFLFQGVRG